MKRDCETSEISETREKAIRLSLVSHSLFLLLFCSIRGFATDYGDISVKVESIASGSAGAGYDEYRATITNRSVNRSHQVTLITPDTPVRNYGPRIVELKRTVAVSPSSTARISLFLPPLTLAGINFAVVIDGRRQEDGVPTDSARAGAWVRRVNNKTYLLVSRSVSKSGLMNQASVEAGLKNPSGEIDVAYLPYEFPLNEWSTNWLGYSRFDGVIASAEDLRAMPEGVSSALWNYIECGGSLLVLGSIEMPKSRQSRQSFVTPSGSIVGQAAPQKSGNDLVINYLGFGVLFVTGEIEAAKISTDQWIRIKEVWEGTRHDDVYYSSIGEINRQFTVVDEIGVPVRGLFLLMIVFVILIGPVNMIWLARRRKKLWLLWTVPAISLLTCLAVSAFSIFGEGFGSTSRTEAMTVLDETAHRATTIGWRAFYSPVTPGGGLHFSDETELQPQLLGRWEYSQGSGFGRSLDWTNDQHLASEWVTARVPAYFKFRKSETRRERLTIRQGANNSLSVVNGLGADIRQLWWADAAGEIYTSTNILAGAQSSLTAINVRADGAADGLREVFKDDDWLSEIKNIEMNPRKSLRANCYLAVLDASPFVEEGLSNVKTRKAKTLVYGIQ